MPDGENKGVRREIESGCHEWVGSKEERARGPPPSPVKLRLSVGLSHKAPFDNLGLRIMDWRRKFEQHGIDILQKTEAEQLPVSSQQVCERMMSELRESKSLFQT